MDINKWLSDFNNAWTGHDVSAVMNLFTDDVEYWETPNTLIKSKQDLVNEWQNINNQQEIKLSTKIYSSCANKHTIIWNLNYSRNEKLFSFSGIYLITLNSNNKCSYFLSVDETKK